MTTMRTKTVRYAFETHLANLATNTTLGTATRHDFAAITVEIPETGSRTFLSVVAVLTWRDAFTTAGTEVTGVRLGSKVGAAAFIDLDRSFTQTDTGDHLLDVWTLDITGNFTTNFGAGATQTCQIGVAVSSDVASNIGGGITCELLITYEFDDDVGTTRVQSIGIPIQSGPTFMSTSHVEIGVTGGTVGAPANQIPALDTYLEESGKTYKQAFIVLESSCAGQATTDFASYVQIDATAEVARATIEQALSTNAPTKDIFTYDTTTHSTASAHAFKMRSDLANRFSCIGGVLWVTYTYNKSTSTRVMAQQLIPFTQYDVDNESLAKGGNPSVGVDPLALQAIFDVQEPGTITLKQSATMFVHDNGAGAPTSFVIAAGGQANRTYTCGSFTHTPIVHRGDHSSGWTIARGRNVWNILYHINGTQKLGSMQAYALVTYSADVPAAGTEAKARAVNFFGKTFETTLTQTSSVAASGGGQRVPTLDAGYSIQGAFIDGTLRLNAGTCLINMAVDIATGEYENGTITNPILAFPIVKVIAGNGSELCCYSFKVPVTRRFKRRNDTLVNGLDIEVAREWYYILGAAALSSWTTWITYHAISYTVSGTLYINHVASGGTVKVYAINPDSTREFIAQGTAAFSGSIGAFSIPVPDNTRNYVAEHHNASNHGASQETTPGGSHTIYASDGTPPASGGSGVPYSRVVNRC